MEEVDQGKLLGYKSHQVWELLVAERICFSGLPTGTALACQGLMGRIIMCLEVSQITAFWVRSCHYRKADAQ